MLEEFYDLSMEAQPPSMQPHLAIVDVSVSRVPPMDALRSWYGKRRYYSPEGAMIGGGLFLTGRALGRT